MLQRAAAQTTVTGGTSTVAERQQRRRRRRQRMRSQNTRGHIQVSGRTFGRFAGPEIATAAAVVPAGLVHVLLPGHTQRRAASDRGRAAANQQYVVHLQPLDSLFPAACFTDLQQKMI